MSSKAEGVFPRVSSRSRFCWLLSEPGISTARPSEASKAGLHRGRVDALRGLLVGLAVLVLRAEFSSAEELKIDQITLGAGGKIKLTYHESATADYYVLMRGSNVTTIDTAIDLVMKGVGVLKDTTVASTRVASFYKVVGWSMNAPGDSDHDGIDDVYELNHPGVLNPLNPEDAMLDPDHDGRPNLWEYRQHTDPLSSLRGPAAPP
ncbi:MAG: hypothetical protein HYR88_02740 [Verrucomicrobia bacterium]|nr:hypothetical protein [Verrucomicrobiota bacterium]MBI3867917.1 hypothetical protein [Verrucomicrobiota bacterium]